MPAPIKKTSRRSHIKQPTPLMCKGLIDYDPVYATGGIVSGHTNPHIATKWASNFSWYSYKFAYGDIIAYGACLIFITI